MFSRKGLRPSNRARIAGLSSDLSLTFVSMLMCVPGLSESKCIAIALHFSTLSNLMAHVSDSL